MSKYDPLTKYLVESNKEEIFLTFDEIEIILGFTLMKSARKYPFIWTDGHGSPFSNSWLKAGYSVRRTGEREQVCFTKVSSAITKRNKPIQRRFKQDEPILDIEEAVAAIKRFHNRNQVGEHTRYNSWIYCYKYFKENWNDKTKIDLLSLHLSWYLASWGMLRGGAFLMDYDYKVHYEVIEELTEPKFHSLYEVDESLDFDLVFEARDIILNGYGKNKPTDTLITKILLGIFGCAPAYDRYFKDSVRRYEISTGSFTKNSLRNVWAYYELYKERFDELAKELKLDEVTYTPMKLVDMALFQLGLENENKESIQ